MHQGQEYARLRARLAIDPMQLDRELMELAPDVQSAAEYCAEAIQIRDALDHAVDVARAEAARKIRILASGSDKKPSEAQIASEVPLDAKVEAAVQEHAEAKLDAALWQALVASFGEKGSSLRRVCEMTVAGFLTPATVYADRRAEMQAKRTADPAFRSELRTR